jgi:hypothetical protein
VIADILDYLDRTGLGQHSVPEPSDLFVLLSRKSEGKLHDICFEISTLLPTQRDRAKGIFNFIANASLGGGRMPCAALACRLGRAQSLALFAAMYADKVLIPDPFGDLALNESISRRNLAVEIGTHLLVLRQIRPLLEADLVGYAPIGDYALCSSCYTKFVESEAQFKERLRILQTHLIDRYQSEAVFKVGQHRNGKIFVEIKGPDDLVEHGAEYLYLTEPNKLWKQKAGSDRPLTRKQITKGRFIDHFVSDAVNNILRQNFHTNVRGDSYLTNRQIEYDLVSKLQEDASRNAAPYFVNDLSHYLPTIENADMSSLVELRRKEGESFQVYRDAMRDVMKDFPIQKPKQMSEIFNDTIRPEINKIELTVKRSKRILRAQIGEDLVFGAAFVSVGLFSGILPINIGEIVSALGGFHYTSSLFSKLNSLRFEPSDARDNRFYFLWKVRKVAAKH